ncbi:MAG: tilS [Rhodospirillales bacterium]|nr:tilS [Rhodospirillales bacterium]
MPSGAVSGGAPSRMPIDADSFSRAMQGFAPFEPEPVVAVAVSGGPDSLALLLLLDVWTRLRGGAVLALTVDHGLRPDADAEASQVGAWAAAHGIAHEVLRWTGEKPGTGVQAAGRAARYRLLSDACAARGILHLAFAHHADDQAETVLFRSERRSGTAGLAGMPSSRSLGAVRLVRPLLAWPKAALIATCRQFGQQFVEDPSNISDRYARSVLRRRLTANPNERADLLETAAAAAAIRCESDRELGRVLGRIGEIRPDGLVTIDRDGLADLATPMRRAVLSAALRTTGGREFAPDAVAVARLDDALHGDLFAGASLAGCIIRLRRDRVLLCREPERAEPPVVLAVGAWQRWDGRYLVRLIPGCGKGPFTVGALGARGYSALRRGYRVGVPAIVGASLPALRSDDRLFAVPAIGWVEEDTPAVELQYLPPWPLSSETFTVVYAEPDIMSL